MAQQERLNRFLARAGVASRRASDRLVQTGQIQVNGLQADHPGMLVDADADQVVYKGRRVRPPSAYTYVLLNKPPGYLVSAKDPHHGQTVFDLLADISARVFPVGRLDLDTWGVLLLTDDGDLSYRLTHPRYGVQKIYRALVRGVPNADAIKRLKAGVMLDDGLTAPAEVYRISRSGKNSTLELSLREGRKRQVKRMCDAVGHRVLRLERVAFAGLTAGKLEPGNWRRLSDAEVACLKGMAERDQGRDGKKGHCGCH